MKKITFTILLIYQLSFASFAQSNSVEIWMRAFIPNPENAGGGKGYINQMPSGGSSVRVQNIVLVNKINYCFATDQRGFSESPNVTSRVETKFTLTLNDDGTTKVSPSQGRTTESISKEVDCVSGALLKEKMGNIDRDIIGTPAVADGQVQVLGQITATNVLTIAGGAGPSIDYSFDIKWKPSTSTLTTSVSIGSFPAFEMYARQPNGKWIKVFQQLPTGAPWQLILDGMGINFYRIVESKVISGISGKWQTPAPEQRFTLDFQGKTVKWTEKNSSGAILTKVANIVELPDGKFKIERPNTDDVLAFLGFQSQIKSDILSKDPQSSYIIFYQNNGKLTTEWNGILATKDANGRLKELIQPGTRPPKIFDLTQIP